MKRIVFFRIIAIILGVGTILGILLGTAKMPNKEKNGFNRNYLNDHLSVINRAPLKEVLSKIGGVSQSSIFLASQNPQALLILNKDLHKRDTLLINANIPLEKMLPFSLYVDTPMLYLHINNMKSVIYGKFPKQDLHQTEIKAQVFTKSIQVSPGALIIRGFSFSAQKQVFQKIDMNTGEVIVESDIIESQDSTAGMSTDGMLLYEPLSTKVIFMEYLKNNFYCLDTNLNLLYKHKTIDTISSNPVEMRDVKQPDGSIKKVPSVARVKVNEQCFADKDNLYIISALKADNESLREFNLRTVIDIYKLDNGSYRGSVAINRNGRKFKSAAMQHDTLIALYDKEIVYYRLNPNVIP